MPRLDYLGWQQHVLSAKSFEVRNDTFSYVGVDGSKDSFPMERLIWLKEEKDHVRICFRKKIPVSGFKIKKKTDKSIFPGFSYVTLADGSKMLVNRRLHRIHK